MKMRGGGGSPDADFRRQLRAVMEPKAVKTDTRNYGKFHSRFRAGFAEGGAVYTPPAQTAFPSVVDLPSIALPGPALPDISLPRPRGLSRLGPGLGTGRAAVKGPLDQ
jgi:hypothetical protein